MEIDYINWLRQQVQQQRVAGAANVVLGIGDDGAILLHDASSKTVWVTDTIVDRVHFDMDQHSMQRIGYKAMAVNLSDIAAMGAVAESALVTFLFPRKISEQDARSLFLGITDAAMKFGVAIVGGDTNRHDGPLTVGVAMTGRLSSTVLCPDGWRMNGAKPGDAILVTGELGGSILSKHLDFTPRLEIARWLQSRIPIHSATDITDSLTIDLGHVIGQSRVGAALDCDAIPISQDAITLSQRSGKPPLQHALHDGEDFELLLTLDPSVAAELIANQESETKLTLIGTITASNAGTIVDGSGALISQAGYEH